MELLAQLHASKAELGEVLVQEAGRRAHVTLSLTRTRTLLAECLEELGRARAGLAQAQAQARGRASKRSATTGGDPRKSLAAHPSSGSHSGEGAGGSNAAGDSGNESKDSGDGDGEEEVGGGGPVQASVPGLSTPTGMGAGAGGSTPGMHGPTPATASREERHLLVTLRRLEVRID